MIARLRPFAFAILSLSLVACGPRAPESATSLDDGLVSGDNGYDPVLAAVVQDPIMTDPQLSFRSNADAIRPPSEPCAAPIPASDIAAGPDAGDGALMTAPAAAAGPCRACATARDSLTLGALVARQGDPRLNRCAATLRYTAGWANRLPADLPLYGGARVIEAAGADGPGCSVRAVSFVTKRSPAHMLDWYFTQASKAGYTIEHHAADGEHVLAGSHPDGTAYTAFVRDDVKDGSEIDLLVSRSR